MVQHQVYWSDVDEGQQLPILAKEFTTTMIVAGALASRDFMPVHHDREYAMKQGARDIFPNILTTGGWVSRFLTDWTGPEGELKKLEMRLGVTLFPGDTLTIMGTVVKKQHDDGLYLVDVEFTGNVPLGMHCTGKAIIALPLNSPTSAS